MPSFIKQIDWFLGQLIQKVKYSFGVPLFFFVIGSFFCYALITNGIKTYRIQSWPEVECEIIDSKLNAVKNENGEDEYRFEVKYKYVFGGHEYESNILDLHVDKGPVFYKDDEQPKKLLKKFKIGNITRCFVNPKEPSYALLERSKTDYIFVAFFPIPLILTLIGLGYLLFIWLFYWDEVTLSGDIVKMSTGAKSSGLVLTIIGTAFIVLIALTTGFWAAFSLAFIGFVIYAFANGLPEAIKKGARFGKRELLTYQTQEAIPKVDYSVENSAKINSHKKLIFSKKEKIIITIAATIFIIIVSNWLRYVFSRASEDNIVWVVVGIFMAFAWTGGLVGTITYGVIVTLRKNKVEKLKPSSEVRVNNKKQLDFSEIVKDLSLWTLIASNIFVLLWAIIEKWPLIEIMWVYWFQSVGIGVIWFLRLWTVKNVYVEKDFHSIGDPKSSLGRKLNALFLIFHYGFFHAGYLAFLAGKSEEIVFRPIYFMALIFFADQLFSFIYHKDWSNTKPVKYGKLVFMPYLRIVPMHITIIGALILKDKLNINFEHTLVVVLFLLLKTVADVSMYINIRQGLTYTAKPKSFTSC
jgi:hypothetical protein